MARMDVPPTQSNLLRIKQELQFAREGYEILDKKREVLTAELMRLAHDAGAFQQEMWVLIAQGYRALEDARMTMGQEHVEWAAMAVNKTVEVDVRYRGVMGVPLPTVEAHDRPPEMPYSLGDTLATLDGAGEAFREAVIRIPELAETVTAVWRLAGELRKTQRRVNALRYIFIPDYEDTVEFIESAIEEREREEAFRIKQLKSRAARPAVGPARREYEQPYRDISGGKRSPIYHDVGGGKPTSRQFG